MRKAKNFSNRLMAMLLSTAMIFTPILQSVPVYAAEADTDTEGIGTLPAESSLEVVGQTGTGDADDGSFLSALTGTLFAASASDFSNVGGWNESIYAEIAGVQDADVTAVSYSGTMSGSLTGDDLKYLVRDSENGVRIDIPGLKAGTYTLTVKVGTSTLTKSDIQVYEYDRSGYAHFKYTDGVGAYKDDGTLKANAVVLYVTDENKNDVTLTCNGITVKGIGNILNSVGQDVGGGKTNNGGTANTNQGIIKALAKAGTPLVVRFIGTVSETGLYKSGTYNASDDGKIDGLTDYSSLNNGGSVGDNGHMARIQSGKDITLEGIGYDAVIDGWGFHYIAEGSAPELGKSFEVRNLTFINTPEDAIGMEGQQASKNTSSDLTSSVERCWIHHNEFYCPKITSPAESDKSEGDGSVDFKRGQYFTCSYNYFDSCHKTNLVGSADYSLQFNLSYHHNHWYMCKARGPLTRNANVHMYNNIVDMQTDYAQNTRANAYIFSEYNMFYACKSPQAVEGGAIKSYHDSIASVIWNKGSAGTVVENKSDYVPNNCQFSARNIKYDKFDVDPELSYIPGNDYQLQTDFAELRKVIVSQTGVQAQNPKLPEQVTASEYSVVPKGTTVNTFESLPQEVSLSKTKNVYAFTVNVPFNLEVAYGASDKIGVLVTEAGENLLSGDGGVVNLPAGTYMIQPVNFQPGNSAKGTTAVFKEMVISSLKLEACDPNAHYHRWVLDSAKSVPATCTEAGKNVYTCSADLNGGKCPEPKEEPVAALGHSYGVWTVVKEATETEPGEKSRSCTRCGAVDTAVIPAGTTGTGGGSTGDDNTGGSTAAGDYVLTFEGLQENDNSDFFTVTGSYSNSKGSTIVNGQTYTDCLKMESKTRISFSCNDGATLFMAFASGESGKKVKVDGTQHTTGADGTVSVELTGGTHEITKGDQINLFYLSIANKAPEITYYTLSFEYNYDDAPEARTVPVASGTSYASMAQLAPASFVRNNYVLKGLYTDASCTTEVSYPYVVNGNATFYADWEEGETPAVVYSVIFNSNGGSPVATVQVSSKQTYVIRQTSTRDGYTFAGWYDAREDGNLVNRIDGSKLTGNITLYAHWNASEALKGSLDCATLQEGDITSKTELNGFTIHALEGGTEPKYYMTVKSGGLYTNGVRITDTSIPGNEDGLLKSIEFTAGALSVLTVDVALSGKPTDGGRYNLVLAKSQSDGSLVETDRTTIDNGTTKVTKKFDIEDAGTYYLYPEGDKGVVYYSLKLTEQVYTVLFLAGTGTVTEGQESVVAGVGEELQLPKCHADRGYIFKGWSLDGGKTLLEDSYTVNVADAVEGVITITAVYESTPDTGLYIQVIEEEYEYTGSAIKPEIEVYNNGELLTEGTDYSVKYSNNVKACTNRSAKNAPKITVTGRGNLTGSTSTTFEIQPKNLDSEDVIKGDIVIASGSKAVPVLVYNNMKLGSKDYIYEDANKRFTESGTITLTGKANGNYTGSCTLDVTVVAKEDLKKFIVEVGREVLTYNGEQQQPTITVKDSVSKEPLEEDSYTIVYGGDQMSAGTQKFTVIGLGEYTGTVAKSYKIKPLAADASAFTVELDQESYSYKKAGVVLGDDLKVFYGDEKELLKEGRDYKVTYSNNKKISTASSKAKYTVSFLGNYKGSKAKSDYFTITAAPLTDDTDGLKIVAADKTYKKPNQYKSAPYVTIDGVALKSSDYKVEYYLSQAMTPDSLMSSSNKVTLADDAPSATVYVKIIGKGNYAPAEGDATAYATTSYEVCRVEAANDLSKAKVTFVDAQGSKLTKVPYTGDELEPLVKVEMKVSGKWVTLETDQYEVTYVNNVNKGRATAVITGSGKDYASGKTANFNIVAQSIKNRTDIWSNIANFFGW